MTMVVSLCGIPVVEMPDYGTGQELLARVGTAGGPVMHVRSHEYACAQVRAGVHGPRMA